MNSFESVKGKVAVVTGGTSSMARFITGAALPVDGGYTSL